MYQETGWMDVSVLLTGHSISVAFSLFLLRNWASYRETVAHFRSFEIFEVLFEVFARLLNLPEVSFTRPTPKILRLFTKSHFRSLFSKREEFLPVFLWLCNGTPFVRQTSRTFELSIRVSQLAKLSRYFNFGMEFLRLVEYGRGILGFSKIHFQGYHFNYYTKLHLRQKVTIAIAIVSFIYLYIHVGDGETPEPSR